MWQINLLPEDLQKTERTRTIRNSAIILVGATLLVLFLIHSLLAGRVGRLEKIAARPTDIKETPQLNQTRQKLSRKEKEVEEFIKLHKGNIEISSQRFFYPQILKLVGDSTSNKVWLEEFLMDSQEGTCVLTGKSFSTRLVSEFMLSLKKSPYFEVVNLSSMEKASITGEKEVDFEMIITLRNSLSMLKIEEMNK